jgi:two-component system response regulator
MKDRIILLVEDNRMDETLTLRALTKSNVGNPVIVARDGAAALDYLFASGTYAERDASDLPAVILLDLKLPKVDGFQVLRRVRADARTRLLPVVILTSSDEDQDRLEGYNSGANSYVRKPIAAAEFTAAVGQLGRYWLQLNQPPPQETSSR